MDSYGPSPNMIKSVPFLRNGPPLSYSSYDTSSPVPLRVESNDLTHAPKLLPWPHPQKTAHQEKKPNAVHVNIPYNQKGDDIKLAHSTSEFWIDDPKKLFQTWEIVPNDAMSEGERLNAMSRVIIIVSVIMLFARFPAWWIFLLLGLLVVVVLWYTIKGRVERDKQIEYLRKPRNRIITPLEETKSAKNNKIITWHTEPLRLVSPPYK